MRLWWFLFVSSDGLAAGYRMDGGGGDGRDGCLVHLRRVSLDAPAAASQSGAARPARAPAHAPQAPRACFQL